MKRAWIFLALAVLLGCAASGCGGRTQQGEAYQLYYRTKDSVTTGSAVGAETVYVQDGSELKILSQLLHKPKSADLQSPFPSTVSVVQFGIKNGVATVDFSEEYNRLTGMELTIADYCVTLTLTQFDTVQKVRITVLGRELPGSAGGYMREDDVLLSGGDGSTVLIKQRLYFPRAEGHDIGYEYRQIEVPEDSTMARAVVDALRAGPEQAGLVSFLPENGGVDVWTENGVCYVNFPASWADKLPKEDGDLNAVLYCLVNSLCRLETVEEVQFLLDGEIPVVWKSSGANEPMMPDPAAGSG